MPRRRHAATADLAARDRCSTCARLFSLDVGSLSCGITGALGTSRGSTCPENTGCGKGSSRKRSPSPRRASSPRSKEITACPGEASAVACAGARRVRTLWHSRSRCDPGRCDLPQTLHLDSVGASPVVGVRRIQSSPSLCWPQEYPASNGAGRDGWLGYERLHTVARLPLEVRSLRPLSRTMPISTSSLRRVRTDESLALRPAVGFLLTNSA